MTNIVMGVSVHTFCAGAGAGVGVGVGGVQVCVRVSVCGCLVVCVCMPHVCMCVLVCVFLGECVAGCVCIVCVCSRSFISGFERNSIIPSPRWTVSLGRPSTWTPSSASHPPLATSHRASERVYAQPSSPPMQECAVPCAL